MTDVCPQCGGENTSVTQTESGGWMHCDDCEDTVEMWEGRR